MTDGLRPYPAYKDSGVPWLGEVPSDWEVLPNRALFAEVKERDHPEEQMLSVTITKGVVRQRTLLADTSKKDSSNLDKSAYKLVCAGDIAYNKMRAWQGAIGASGLRGIVSPAYVVERPRAGTDSRYLHHLLRTPSFAKEAERWSYGITSDMWSLRPEHFRMISACRPPAQAQSAIVRFLDHADQRIRRYILAKQKLIKLLEEQKQAIIHRAVTCGVDPSVRLKPSGVPWLGDIPQRWEVRRLSSVAQFQSGKAHEQFVDLAGENVCVTARFVSTDGKSRKYCTKNFCPAMKDDVLMVMSDLPNGRALARAFYVDDDTRYAVNQRVCIIRAHAMNPKFLAYSANRNVSLLRNDDGANQTHLSNGDFKTMPLVCPPREEQDLIVRKLDRETGAITITAEAADREIELLREYRSRLVADVVTGKLDVRAAAASLPDEAEELEPVDADALVEDNVEADDSEVAAASEGVEE